MSCTPKQVLYELREGQVDNTLEQIVDQLFSLVSVSPTSLSQALYDGVNFLLRRSVFYSILKFFVQLLTPRKKLVDLADVA